MNKNRLAVNLSILIFSDVMLLLIKKSRVCSMSFTSKAKWRKPQDSGREGLWGVLGKENNSTTKPAFKVRSNLYDSRSWR